MKYKVLVSDSLSDKGLEILKNEKDIEVTVKTDFTPEELKKEIKKYDALLIRSGTKVTKEIIENADNLKVIGRAGVGVDNVDIPAASKKGIVVMNTPSGNTLSTAEQTITMLLSLARNIPQANASMKKKEWERKAFMGVEVNSKVLGIVGFGRIGQEVAKRMKSFGMDIIAYDPFMPTETANSIGVKMTDNLDDIYKAADFITVHTPLTEETRDLISKKTIAKMKKGVRIINCARGGIVNEQDICEAIKEGKVAGAAIDVYEEEPPKNTPLYYEDKVIMTPHLGASTKEAQVNVAIDVAKQVVDMLIKGEVKNAVNFPYIAPELFKKLKPFIGLCEKIGAMISNIASGRYKEIEIEYRGDVCDFDTSPLSLAVLKGIFTPIIKETINFVNAPFIVKERGIKVNEIKTKDLEDFAHLITVKVKTEDGKFTSVSGTLFGKSDVRIVKINGYIVDARPEGLMLFCENLDTPGFVGKIGTLLGENNINIASMALGRKEKGQNALVVFNIDDDISKEVLTKIKALDQIVDAKVLSL
ncbi:phosphoglycerate dehydrogenase [bacterium]|nr:phosphoglycerate dehydrogenase [bacterium]